MGIFRVCVLLCLAAPCAAQTVSSAPSIPTDLSNVPTLAQVQAMQTAAIAAATPAACGAPAPDVPGGAAGTGPICMRRQDSARPSKGLWTQTVTDASCNVTWTFRNPDGSPYAFLNPPIVGVTFQDTGAAPMPVIPLITANSVSSVTIRAYRLRLLPASITLVTALVNFDISAGTCAGITAHMSAREKL